VKQTEQIDFGIGVKGKTAVKVFNDFQHSGQDCDMAILRQLIDLETLGSVGMLSPPQGRRPCTPVKKQKV
jgi:hypothetical protein